MLNRDKLLLLFGFIIIGLSQSCEKYDGDSYNFADTTANYITFNADDVVFVNSEVTDTVTNKHIADTVSINLVTRMNLPYDVNYVYAVEIDGGQTIDISGVYAKETTAKAIELSTTDDMFPAGKDTIKGTIVLKSASGELGSLVIGYPDPDGAKVSFVAYKPGT